VSRHGSLTRLLVSPRHSDMTADAILDAHVRALMSSQPTDVVSSERHTVKP
jgi:hypothetical protein